MGAEARERQAGLFDHLAYLRRVAEGLKIFGALPDLMSFELSEVGITGAGVAHLARLNKLETLVLDSNAGVTDAAIEHSAKLAALKAIAVRQTGVTGECAARLRAAIPRCNIIRE